MSASLAKESAVCKPGPKMLKGRSSEVWDPDVTVMLWSRCVCITVRFTSAPCFEFCGLCREPRGLCGYCPQEAEAGCCCTTDAFRKEELGSLLYPRGLGWGFIAVTGAVLNLALSKDLENSLSWGWCVWLSIKWPPFPVGGSCLELFILGSLADACPSNWGCSRFLLLVFSTMREEQLLKSFLFFNSNPILPDGMAVAEAGILEYHPLDNTSTFPGSISFCQFLKSFFARLARSSFFVFFRTSLMSLPRRVSFKNIKTVLHSGCYLFEGNYVYSGIQKHLCPTSRASLVIGYFSKKEITSITTTILLIWGGKKTGLYFVVIISINMFNLFLCHKERFWNNASYVSSKE